MWQSKAHFMVASRTKWSQKTDFDNRDSDQTISHYENKAKTYTLYI